MNCIVASCLCSVVVSIIVNRIIAIHYMKIIDSYADDVIRILKDFIRTTNI